MIEIEDKRLGVNLCQPQFKKHLNALLSLDAYPNDGCPEPLELSGRFGELMQALHKHL